MFRFKQLLEDTFAGLADGSIVPDVTIVHVQRADEYGNAHAWGNLGVTREACLASQHVIVTAEGMNVYPEDLESALRGLPELEKRVNSGEGFNRVIAHAPKGRPVVLRVRRAAAAIYLALRVEG